MVKASERARRDFYDRVSKSFDEPEMKDLFTRLRDWETQHIKKIEEIKDRTAQLQEPQTAESYEGEFGDYVKLLIEDKLYREVTAEDFKKNVKDSFTAIRIGMSFERDAILFFSEVDRFVIEPHKGVIRELIDEERKHLVYLSELRKSLQK